MVPPRSLASPAVRRLLSVCLAWQMAAVAFAEGTAPMAQSLDRLPVRRLAWSATEPLARLTVEHQAAGERPRRFQLPADQIDHPWWRSLRIGPAQRLWLSWPLETSHPDIPLPPLGLEASLEQLIGRSVVVTASRSRAVAGRVMGIESRRVLLQRLDAAEQLVQIPINDIESLELSIEGASQPLADWVGLPSGPLQLRLSPAPDGRDPLRLSYTLPPPAWQLRYRLESADAASDAPLLITSYLDLHHVGDSAWEQVEVSVGLADGWQTLGPVDLAVGEVSQWPLKQPTAETVQVHWEYRLDLNQLQRSHPLPGFPTLRLSQSARPLAAGVVEWVTDRASFLNQQRTGRWRLRDTLWPGGEQELQPDEPSEGGVVDDPAAGTWPRWQVLERGRAGIELRASRQPGVIWRCYTQRLVGELVGAGPNRIPVRMTAATAANVQIDQLPRTIDLNAEAPLRIELKLELEQPEAIDLRQAALETLERLQREVTSGDWQTWLDQVLSLRRQQEQAYRDWELAQTAWRFEQHERALSRWRGTASDSGERLPAAQLAPHFTSSARGQLRAESAAIRLIDQQLQRLMSAPP